MEKHLVPPKSPKIEVTSAIGAISFFGLSEETKNYIKVLDPLFINAHSIFDIYRNFSALNTLEQGGAFLYAGLAVTSTVALLWAIFSLTKHHSGRAIRHLAPLARALKRKTKKYKKSPQASPSGVGSVS